MTVYQAYIALIVFTPVTLARSQAEAYYFAASNPDHPLALEPLDEPASLGLSIVVPAYNERERLGIMVDEAMEYLLNSIHQQGKTGTDWYKDGVELIVVDDGSKDDTARIAIDLAQKWAKVVKDKQLAAQKENGNVPQVPIEMRIVKLERNRGKGGAVRHVSDRVQHATRLFFADVILLGLY